ncbi:DUF2208 domain-containing protein [Candidatus Bathyarchaeota archaeon]|nr:DUF2208 domain-containing protein [Candidatus Bathyarchaeota archaeon]
MADNEILYETNSNSLKNTDRNMRIYRAILIFMLDLAILFSVLFLFGIWISIISFLILAVLILPTPLLIVPGRYRILKKGLDSDGKRIIPLKPSYRTKLNHQRRFVSIIHARRGECIRLYSEEPQQVQIAVQKVTRRR